MTENPETVEVADTGPAPKYNLTREEENARQARVVGYRALADDIIVRGKMYRRGEEIEGGLTVEEARNLTDHGVPLEKVDDEEHEEQPT